MTAKSNISPFDEPNVFDDEHPALPNAGVRPVRFAVYLRYSSDLQDGENSITSQLSHAENYAARNNGSVAKVYDDWSISATKDTRPAFLQMIEDALSDNPPFDHILIWKFSRFARNMIDSAKYKLMLRQRGIRVISITEQVSDDAAGRLVERVIEVIDEFQAETISDNVKRGMRELAQRGFFLGSQAPIGYKIKPHPDGDKTRKKLAPDPPRDEIPRLAFHLALNSYSILQITKMLNDRGYRSSKGKKFTRSTVHDILRNEHYTGYIVFGVKNKDGSPPVRSREQAHPQIVSPGDFAQVQQMLHERAPSKIHPRTAASEHLLNELCRCGLCDNKIVAKSAKGGEYYYLTCLTRYHHGKSACPLQPYPCNINEPIILDAILLTILTTENVKDLVETVKLTAKPLYERQIAQIANIDDQCARLDRRENNLLDEVENGRFDPEKLDARIAAIREQVDELTAKRADIVAQIGDDATILDDPDLIIQYAADLRTYLQSATVKGANAFLRSFIKTIRFSPGYATIEYTVPFPGLPKTGKTSTQIVGLGNKVLSTVRPPRPAITLHSLRIAGLSLRIAAPRRHLHRPVLQCPPHFPERLLIAGAGDVGLFHRSDFGRPGGGGNSVANLPGFFGHSLLLGRRVHTDPLRVARSILGFALVGQPLAHLPVPPDAGDQRGHQLAETALMGDSQQVAGVRVRRRRVPRCVKVGLGDAEPGAIGTVQVHLGVQDVIHRAGEPAHRRQVGCFGCRQCQASGKIHQVNVILGDEMPEPVHRQRPVPDTPNEWMVCHRLALGCRFPFYLLTK